jgi:hypothetical protein
MAEDRNQAVQYDDVDPDASIPKPNEDREREHERVRASNDRDQELEREGRPTRHEMYDAVVKGLKTPHA